MTDAPNAWREKYLDALDEHERLEARLDECQSALRRAYIHLSAAVSGQNSELDTALLQARDRLKPGASSDFSAALQKVEKHLEALETFQAQQKNLGLSALLNACHSLRRLRLPNPALQNLNQFTQRLEREIPTPAMLARALEDWQQLLEQALAAAALPDVSLWQRLRGGRRLPADEAPAQSDFYQTIPAAPTNPAAEPDLQLDAVTHKCQVPIDQQPVAEHIAAVLQQLLDLLNPTEALLPRVTDLRARIDSGLSWQQLGEALEELRDLYAQASSSLDSELTDYLERVNDDLAQICQQLGAVLAVSNQSTALAEPLSQLAQSVKNATDLESLKREVSAQISGIHSALNQLANPWQEELPKLLERLQLMERQSQHTQKLLERERLRATFDSLTELPNREAFNQRIKLEWQRYKRYGQGLTLAICDIDHFKRFNDQFGHQVGDRVLKLVSKALAKRLREVDFVARYGGEEFVVILPQTPLPNALKTLDKIRAAIASLAFRFRDEPVQISLSFGLAFSLDAETANQLFARADEALYAAKNAGRNCCIAWSKPPGETPEA
ncbi:MAG TPA: diguanylate cyclase [Cellvibrionaceae bacterium]|nr:diguanylate cyclase [Cellvibrionaceae bacterium]